MEIATEEENSLLEAWKKYRVLLNRVNTTTAPDIEWPVALDLPLYFQTGGVS
ncbi:TPA: tail fiber assembly protein [Escherichia coli]|nr:tail fiber assembly protein [Escherichia coli]